MSYHILFVEDEDGLRKMVQDILVQAGYQVTTAASCAQARKQRAKPDMLLLDVMLPDGDGFALLEELRQHTDIPAIFLSARDEDTARLHGLGLGADDYIVKPFLLQELCLRIAAVLRRVYKTRLSAAEVQSVQLGRTVIDWGAGTVQNSRGSATLTAKEYALLKKLWENQGNIVTVDALCQALWEGTLVGYENTLMVHIRRLREKIEEEPSHPKYLLTVRGLGYRLLREASQ